MDRRQFLGGSLGGLAATGTRAVPAVRARGGPSRAAAGAGGRDALQRHPAAGPLAAAARRRRSTNRRSRPLPDRRRPRSSRSTSAASSSSTTSSSSRRPSRARYHRPKYHPGSPVLEPDQPWEQAGRAMAMVFSDGVWYDPQDRLFKMWYMGGYAARHLLRDLARTGFAGRSPTLDVVKTGTNIVQPGPRDSVDRLARPGGERPAEAVQDVPLRLRAGQRKRLRPDGVLLRATASTGASRRRLTGSCGDRTTVFYNPFRKVWVYSLRHGWGAAAPPAATGRRADLLAGPMWKRDRRAAAVGRRRQLDPQRDDLQDAAASSTTSTASPTRACCSACSPSGAASPEGAGRKPNEVVRRLQPRRLPLAPARTAAPSARSPRSPATGTGATCSRPAAAAWSSATSSTSTSAAGPARGRPDAGRSTTGLAILRRDGFASMDAGDDGRHADHPAGAASGASTSSSTSTRPRRRTARRGARRGRPGHRPVSRGRTACPVRADKTKQAVTWKGGATWPLAGKPVRFRFHLKNGELYAFWVSPTDRVPAAATSPPGGPGSPRTVGHRGPQEDLER